MTWITKDRNIILFKYYWLLLSFGFLSCDQFGLYHILIKILNATLIFYPPSLAKNTCTYLRSTLLHYSQPLASEDVFYRELSFQCPDRAWRHAQIFWAGLMIHYVDCSSSSFKHMFSYKKKKIDDIVWKTKSKIWIWLNRLYSMKLKKKIPGCQYNILYIHLFDVLWKGP